jgi:uncharacterized membrane protein YsdA (DUF1294 family)/cold shock CspA family protein
MRHTGKLTTWNDAKGFGFIQPKDNTEQVFVHAKAFNAGRPSGNETISYELAYDEHGRARAEHASIIAQPMFAALSGERGMVTFALLALISAVTVGYSIAGTLPLALASLYAVLSLITFAAYASDKSAAKQGRQRTSERTLHVLGLLGGWPGALLAQRILRHKSSKTSFQWIFGIIVLLNCGGLAWLLSASTAWL